MNPFGNRDEPEPPAWYLPDRSYRWRWLCWYVRNPLHNWSHYMAGWVGQPYTLTTSGGDNDNDGFVDAGGWLWARLWLGPRWRPYLSYRGATECYAGWHPTTGKLGFRGWPVAVVALVLLAGLTAAAWRVLG